MEIPEHNVNTRLVIGMSARVADEVCTVDTDILHDTLKCLPAEKYLKLFGLMYREVLGNINPPPIN